MKEEVKAINNSVKESELQGAILNEESADGKNKSKKIIIYAIFGVAGLCVLLWLIIGRAEAYAYDSENDDLKKGAKEKDKEITSLRKDRDKLIEDVSVLKINIDALSNKNAHLREEVRVKDQTIDELKGKVAEKDEENVELKKKIHEHELTIDSLRRKITTLEDKISEITDEANELYLDTRMIASILNQELNRNQALTKEIDSLEATVSQQTALISTLHWKILTMTEELHDAKVANTLQWIGLTLIEKKFKHTVSFENVYKGTRKECDSIKFRKQIEDKSPNFFIATENSTGLIFGGYTSVDWNGESGFKEDLAAFTFSATHRAICKLNDATKAINIDKKRNNNKLMLTFGNFDITIGDNCIQDKLHEIQLGKTYDCPAVGPKYFYTEEQKPTLSHFDFYKVTVNTNA